MIQAIIYFFVVGKLSVAPGVSKLGVNVGELSNVWASCSHLALMREERDQRNRPVFENETTKPRALTMLSRFISNDGFPLVRARTSQLELPVWSFSR